MKRIFALLALAGVMLPCAASGSAFSSADHEIGTLIAAREGPADPTKPVIRMLVTKFAQPNSHTPLIDATIASLRQLYGPGNFTVRVYTGETSDIRDAELVLSSAGTYVRTIGKGARDLATAASDLVPNPNKAEGSLFITTASHPGIADFVHLGGQRVVATGPNAFGGYHAALGEIARRGYDPDTFFSGFVASGHDMRLELDILRRGEADVGVVRTCFLEELRKQGVDVGDIRPVAVREGIHPGGCLSSTDLYPNWTIFATPSLTPEDARKITQTLLAMPKGPGGVHWSIASDFSSTDDLYRSIRLGPYEYLRTWTWDRFWQENKTWIVCLLMGVIGLAVHAWRSGHLVEIRTAQLKKAITEQKEAEGKAKAATDRMQALQRAGAVGQMSSIIAHELRQPLSAIVSYAHGLGRLADNGRPVDPGMLSRGLASMRSEAERAESIVEKVRSYAKGSRPPRVDVDLEPFCRDVLATMQNARISTARVETNFCKPALVVNADVLELELCLHNILKNAFLAAGASKEPCVMLRTFRADLGGSRTKAVIEVADNGPALDDESFARLTEVLHSSRIDGLGLGLAIVRTIAENHGGSIVFERRVPNGLAVRLLLPEVAN